METSTITIHTADDEKTSNLTTQLGIYRLAGSEMLKRRPVSFDVYPKHGTKDPLTEGLVEYFVHTLKYRKGKLLFIISTASFIVDTRDGKYSLNGKQMPRVRIAYVLGKVLYKSVFEKDTTKLIMYSHDVAQTPEEVTYVIENRMPYHYYQRGVGKVQVRLNVTRIGDSECAVEIGDGVWGNMSFADIKSFCLAYGGKSGKKARTNKWSLISPAQLYEKLTGNPMDTESSDYKVLISFLEQNRTQKIVEERAKQLVLDVAKKYDNIEVLIKGDTLSMLVKGRENYWKIVGDINSNVGHHGRQNVRSYVLQNEKWQGPICIDNANTHSSVGDQLVARALPMMNDHIMKQMVYTIRSYAKEAQLDKISFEQLIANEKGEGYEEVQSL